jgi:ABC-type dipeptide/oligopeptide/nickel transport system ATPase component
MPLLSLHISVDYPGSAGVLRDVAFDIEAGEILGLAGQSGSGKSTLALAVLRLLDGRGGRAAGHARFQGRDLLALPERELRRMRGRDMALVPQSPLAALNPHLRIGAQLAEAWRAHRDGKTSFTDLLAMVSLPAGEEFLRRYPRQLSVGQAQRVLIAMAVLHRPALIVADEPTSALDAITQAEILELFRRLNRELGVAILYISHDLASVAALCHRLAILHDGRIIETGRTEDIFHSPLHPYARRLIEALPRMPQTSETATAQGLRNLAGAVSPPVVLHSVGSTSRSTATG